MHAGISLFAYFIGSMSNAVASVDSRQVLFSSVPLTVSLSQGEPARQDLAPHPFQLTLVASPLSSTYKTATATGLPIAQERGGGRVPCASQLPSVSILVPRA